MWLGDKKWAIVYAVKSKRKGYYLTVQAFLPFEDSKTLDMGWTDNISRESIMEMVGECEPRWDSQLTLSNVLAMLTCSLPY